MNLSVLLSNIAQTHSDRPAVVLGDTTVHTFSQLKACAHGLGGGLRQQACVPGQRIGILMPNRPEYLEVLWGCWIAGLCAVPINAKLHAREISYVLEHSGCTVLFVSEATISDAVSACAGLEFPPQIVEVGTADYATLIRHEPIAEVDVVDDAPAWLFYTSGTTGRPKGATLTHRNLLGTTLRYYADVDFVGENESMVHLAPLSHGTGLYSLALLAKGAAQVIPPSGAFNADEAFDLLSQHRKVTTFLAPTMLMRLVNHPRARQVPAEHWQTIFYGGAPMYVADLKRALDCFGPCLWQGYGQGESPCTITSLTKAMHADRRHPDFERRLASAGVARTGVSVRIVDDQDKELPIGGIGEVVVRSDVTMAGYWRDPQASAEALRGGWLHTGDIGEMSADGLLTLRDRSKDLVISGGSNIYPREIEEVLLKHPRVLEASVVGAPHPDWGEAVVAFVVSCDAAELRTEELDKLCLANIARFKRPKRYIQITALPKNHYGKVLKTELRARLKRENELTA